MENLWKKVEHHIDRVKDFFYEKKGIGVFKILEQKSGENCLFYFAIEKSLSWIKIINKLKFDPSEIQDLIVIIIVPDDINGELYYWKKYQF